MSFCQNDISIRREARFYDPRVARTEKWKSQRSIWNIMRYLSTSKAKSFSIRGQSIRKQSVKKQREKENFFTSFRWKIKNTVVLSPDYRNESEKAPRWIGTADRSFSAYRLHIYGIMPKFCCIFMRNIRYNHILRKSVCLSEWQNPNKMQASSLLNPPLWIGQISEAVASCPWNWKPP